MTGSDRRAQEYVTLDYATLGQEYENRLETIERGFSMNVEFLEAWVPDDDVDKSLFYLFEAGALHGLPGLSVALTKELLPSIDSEELLRTLKSLGEVEVVNEENRVLLTVSFGKSSDATPALDGIRGLFALAKTYQDKLVRETHKRTHSLDSPLSVAAATYSSMGLRVFDEEFQGGKVLIAIDPKDGHLRALRYEGMADDAVSRMLDLLCRLMEGCPIQEMAEHGAIRLENFLRNPLMPPPVRGLITPDNAGAEFATLNRLGRQIFSRYRKEHGTSIERNTTEFPVTSQWLTLSQEARIEAISRGVAAFLETRQLPKVKVNVVQLVNDTQIFATMEGCDSEQERRMMFRALEKDLKRGVEPRLELYLPTVHDRLQRDQISDLMTSNRTAEGIATDGEHGGR